MIHPLSFLLRGLRRSLHAIVLFAVAFVMAGCGPGQDAPAAALPDAGPAACPPGEMPLESGGCQPAGLPPDMQCAPGELALDNGGCQPAGLPPDMPCPPGETLLPDGGCQPAGVPPDACGQGFEPDGQGGCNAILPPDPCPPGKMAIPGETQCRDVAPCGTGDYGMIPVDATTQFVDAAYPGTDSDGTQGKPWKKIQHGINQAKVDGAIVAVAAGTYTEDLLIQSRPIRLWGRCPAMVEVVGTGAQTATLNISALSASDSEVHQLAITGPGGGILTGAAGHVVIDRVWIHDTGYGGIQVEHMPAPNGAAIAASLIENTQGPAIFASGSDVMLEGTVVRESSGTFGRGIEIQRYAATQQRSTLTVRTSLLERNEDVGVFAVGSDATIEATVVRASQKDIGIRIQPDPATQEPAKLTLRTSLLDQNHTFGVLVEGSDATIEATIVRATQPNILTGTDGFGIGCVGTENSPKRATLTLRDSLVEQNHDSGVIVQSSDATVVATVVRTTQRASDGTGGVGIALQRQGIILQGITTPHERGTLLLRASLVEHNDGHGVLINGSDATIETTTMRMGERHGSISVQSDSVTHEPGTLSLRASLVEQNRGVGVLVTGSDATIEATVVRDTERDSDGTGGDGIAVQADVATQQRGKLTVHTSLLEQNHRVGVNVVGSDATIETTVVRDTQPNSDGTDGAGIGIFEDSNTRLRANLTLRHSLLDQNGRIGVYIESSDATIDATVVRNTQPGGDAAGYGVKMEQDAETHERASVMLRNSIVEQNHAIGVVVMGSDATIDATIVRGTQPRSDGTAGAGIVIREDGATQDKANATLRTSLVAENHYVGVLVQNSDATIDATVVRATQPQSDGIAGDGIAVESGGVPTKVSISSSQIEANARAGIANFSAEVILVSTRVQCNPINLNGEDTVDGQPFTFDGSKDNLCGCPDEPDPTCPVRSSNLSPPDPIVPPGP